MLLILAGVSIATLTGDNGLLNKAGEAKEQTEVAEVKDRAQLDILDWQADQLKDNNDATLNDDIVKGILDGKDYISGFNEEDLENIKVITENGYEFPISDLYDKEDKAGGDEAVPGEIVTGGNKNYTNNGKAKIPVGFMVVPGANDVSKGLVISDNPADTEVDSNNIVAEGNQFVWIPVNKDNLCVDGIEGKEVAEKIASGTDYRGVLYDFDSGTPEKIEYSSTGYREPDVVTGSSGSDYDNDTEYLGIMNNILKNVDDNFTEFTNADEFKSYMQIEYNNIINSIKTNGGFYIGRYESSLSSSDADTDGATGNIQSKRNILPVGADKSGAYRWYGLYAKQKEFASTLEGTTVKSAMIYGSMYDAVMNWALNDPTEASKVTGPSTSRGLKQPTGTEVEEGKYDIIKNIYDLGNNMYEWTAEANSAYNRVYRGSDSYNTFSPSYRNLNYPHLRNRHYGSRLLLYL